MAHATIDSTSNTTTVSNEANLEQAGKFISDAMKWSVAASVIPVPNLDLVAIAAVQANMVNDIAHVYGSKLSKEAVKASVSVLLGVLAPVGATSVVVSSTMKFFPGYGSVIGGISLAGFAAASTYAIGKVFVAHFENGGTLADFDVKSVTIRLKEEFSNAPTKAATA
jgi:uncharacterized protein (DUF697 family)